MRLSPLVVISLLSGLLIALFVRRILSESAPGSRAEPVSAALVLGAKDPTSDEKSPHGKPEQVSARVKELERMAEDKRQRDHAAEKTHDSRKKLQFNRHRAWLEVVQANRQTFEDLRREAAHSQDKLVPCTICDAKGVVDLCVVCEHTGKCPTCRGTGKDFGEVCPTCQGSGKCFLCFGAGKMPCPFCQSLPLRKEVITPDTPDPVAEIPID